MAGLLEQAQQYFGLGISPQGPTGASRLEMMAEDEKRRREADYAERLKYDEVGLEPVSFLMGVDSQDPNAGLLNYVSPADVVAGGIGLAGLARSGAGALHKGTANLINEIKGFYDPNPVSTGASAANMFAKSIGGTFRQAMSPKASATFSDTGIGFNTSNIVRNNLNKLDSLKAKPYLETTDEMLDESKNIGKVLYGQMGAAALMKLQGKQAGYKGSGPLDEWIDLNYWGVGSADEYPSIAKKWENSSNVSDQIMSDGMDMVKKTWGLPDDSLVAVKKWKIGTAGGTHDRDVIKSSQFNHIKKVLIANGRDFRNVNELYNTLMQNAKNGGYNVIKATNDGVYINFSPQGKSGFVEGGFNAGILVKPDRKQVFFVSDEHDLFGQVPPGYSNLATVYPPWQIDPIKKYRPVFEKGGGGNVVQEARTAIRSPAKPTENVDKAAEDAGIKISKEPKVGGKVKNGGLTQKQIDIMRKVADYTPSKEGYARYAMNRAATATPLIYYGLEEDDN